MLNHFLGTHYQKFPGMLILRLMSRCNLCCQFCMVADEIKISQPMPLENLKLLISEQPSGTQIVFFGGEPTIHPYFLKLLRFARERGFPCSISTHAGTFASRKFTKAVSALGAHAIGIQTSLYGPTSVIHDWLTRRSGSFRRTSQGIQNLLNVGFSDIVVNVLIVSSNVKYLAKTVSYLKNLGVSNVKFSMLVGGINYPHLLCHLGVVRTQLRFAIETATSLGMSFAIEKAPLCVAPQYLHCFIYDHITSPGDGLFMEQCSNCLGRSRCFGLDKGYVQVFENSGVEPLLSVSPECVTVIADSGALDSFEPRANFLNVVAWDLYQENDIATLTKLVRLRANTLEKCADVLFVSSDQIDKLARQSKETEMEVRNS